MTVLPMERMSCWPSPTASARAGAAKAHTARREKRAGRNFIASMDRPDGEEPRGQDWLRRQRFVTAARPTPGTISRQTRTLWWVAKRQSSCRAIAADHQDTKTPRKFRSRRRLESQVLVP